GARREEIGRLKWSEIDEIAVPEEKDRPRLVFPAINLEGLRTKNGEAHIIPLSVPAAAILEKIPRIGGSDFVFTIGGRSPVSGWSRAKIDLDDLAQIAPWRTHDLRRTTATGLQKLGTALQVTEAVLGHTAGSRGGIVGVYQRHSYAREKV